MPAEQKRAHMVGLNKRGRVIIQRQANSWALTRESLCPRCNCEPARAEGSGEAGGQNRVGSSGWTRKHGGEVPLSIEDVLGEEEEPRSHDRRAAKNPP